MALKVVPIFYLGAVFPEENEALSELEEIDFLQAVVDDVASGALTEDEARAIVNREEELNAVRR